MHYCTFLFTENLPSEKEIYKIMEKYNEEYYFSENDSTKEYPSFMWDWYTIGGRYNGLLKLKVDFDSDNEYEWKYLAKEDRNNRLFISSMLTRAKENEKQKFMYSMYSEECYFPTMGSRDGYIRVDGAKIKDILNCEEIGGYNAIFADGTSTTRSKWNGKEWVDNPNYDNEVHEYMNNHKDYFLTVLDIHD